MPKTNYTVDNINPAITYSPSSSWIDGSQEDTQWNRYSNNGTFKITLTTDATATFTFNGTGVWVYGAKRMNHGKYSVNLDGKSAGTFDGQGPDEFQIILYSAISLAHGLHTVSFINAPLKDRGYFDIDFITYETDIGTPEETPEISIVQDGDHQFTYSPPTSWSTTSDKLQGFNESTGHLTDQNAGFVTCDFTGDAISIWGSIGPDNGPYSVSLDGGEPKSFNASSAKYFSQVRLYEANNLGPGEHSVVITNQPQVVGQVMTVDYAVITNTAITKAAAQQPQSSHGLSGGAKAGIAVGVVVGVVAVFALLWLFLIRRRKTRAAPRTQTAQFLDKFEPAPSATPPSLAPIQESSLAYTPYPLHSTTQPSPSKVVHLMYSGPTSQDSLLAEPIPHMHSAAIPDTVHDNHQFMSAVAMNSPTSLVESFSTQRISGSAANEKVTPPSPASETTPAPRRSFQTPGQGLEGRIREPGREIDAGPLPPSYVQATQPI